MSRRRVPLVAMALTLIPMLGACGRTTPTSTATATSTTAASPTPASTSTSTTTTVVPPVGRVRQPVPVGAAPDRVVPPSPPTVLTIPSIGVRTGLEHLGLDGNGVLQPPVDDALAGWYTGGPQPGQDGPAVIAGHLDSATGPAVFARLDELRIGDTFTVERADGSVLPFVVTAERRAPKSAFPTALVYGPVPRPELRLITCGGDFDRSTGHYRDNVIVFAALA